MPTRSFIVPMPHGPPRTYSSIEEVLAHAHAHARNRLLHSCEAISWIGRLARMWKRPYTPTFTIEGAEVQDARAGHGEQAAHILPGQIQIDGRNPWALVGGHALKVAWLARFMVTSPVPIPFNTADSAAEKAGLKEAFRVSCEDAWRRVARGEQSLMPTYEEFLSAADRAFLSAQWGKHEKRRSTFLKGETAASDDRFVEGLILRMYRTNGVTAKDANRTFPLEARAS
jgi:hypothetical protein